MMEGFDRYETVGVLMPQWEDGPGQDLGLAAEVRDLRALFEDDLKFSVESVHLRPVESDPQAQLDEAMNALVHKYDGRSERSLLVVYYSGHGLVADATPNDLVLKWYVRSTYQRKMPTNHGIGRRGTGSDTGRQNDESGSRCGRASWAQAEQSLRERAVCDTLVILDCCFAGHVLTDLDRSESGRCYEVMVATGWNGYTPSPGPRSYTALLIESLKELRAGREPVTTLDLAQTIMQKQKWKGPSNLHPVFLGCGGRHIVLAPPTSAGVTMKGSK